MKRRTFLQSAASLPAHGESLAGDPAHQATRDDLKARMVDWPITATDTNQIAEKWLV